LQRPVEPAGAPAGAWANTAVELIRATAVAATNREIFIFVSCDKRNAEKVPRKKQALAEGDDAAANRHGVEILVNDCNTERRYPVVFLNRALSGAKRA
jgi:hypothetical protein